MVIIAILSAGAILSLSAFGQDRELENESDRLVTLLNYAHEQADLQTREIGLYCGEHGYRFLAFDARTNLWGDIESGAVKTLELKPGDLTLGASAELKPHVMIFSNGDLTSFELTLERDGTERTATLVPDDQGRVKRRPAVPEHGT